MKVTNLRQGDYPGRLGVGACTIPGAGCALTAYTMAVNAFQGTHYTPTQINDRLLRANGFSGSSLIRSVFHRQLNLVATRIPVDFARAYDELESGSRLVLCGVDYKPGHSSGMSEADHFVLMHSTAMTGDKRPAIVAADPATGHDVSFENYVPKKMFVAGKRDMVMKDIDENFDKPVIVSRVSVRVVWRACEMFVLQDDIDHP